jgi:SAM-dependent methyltransferase
LTDVLEHLSDPQKAVRVIREALKDQGRLLLKVPCGKFALLKHRLRKPLGFLLRSPDIFDAKEHYVFYSRKALHRLMEDNGFRVLETHIPKPVQTGGSGVFTRWARTCFYRLGRTGVLPAQDLLVVAQVSK